RLWVVTAEAALLDRVRASFDRPSLGRSDPSPYRPALQALPLALAMQVAPQSPQTALELLTLPISPIPGPLRRGLVRALAAQPAVHSPAWDEASRQGLEALAELNPDRDQNGVRERLETIFPTDPAERVTASRAAAVADVIAAWARARG